ncbi:hypothetical protein H920_07695 [Fukomys damarensis]|uniref:Uncharacterized protein n=1 Tax=Fukomys damarensis TaxID=885580 RepID=A0A091DKT7_FUKDA|nr:hypothetical protein H920_07695 [Fukomys damarensis]
MGTLKPSVEVETGDPALAPARGSIREILPLAPGATSSAVLAAHTAGVSGQRVAEDPAGGKERANPPAAPRGQPGHPMGDIDFSVENFSSPIALTLLLLRGIPYLLT